MLVGSILKLPDVVETKKGDIITEENWPVVEAAFDEALAAVNDYRAREGEALYKDVTGRIPKILSLYDDVESHEAERITTVKERILKNLGDLGLQPDKERFEQEMVFYLEKMDINEEKVRLRQHCKWDARSTRRGRRPTMPRSRRMS